MRTPSVLRLDFKMTAAATTGPAHGPRPASSTPAMSSKPAAWARVSGGGRLLGTLDVRPTFPGTLNICSPSLAWRRGRFSRFSGFDPDFADLRAEEIEAGATDLRPSKDLNPFQDRGMKWKDPLHPFPVGEPSDRHRGGKSAAPSAEHDALKRGETHPIPL